MENTNQQSSSSFWQKAQLYWERTKDIFGAIGRVLGIIGKVFYHLRKVFMAVPVVVAALYLARMCRDTLTGMFRFHILDVVASFEQSEMIIRQVEISRQVAIFGPLVVTGGCLLLMFLSRRTVFPWLISVFSLVIPAFILFSSMYLTA